MDLESITKVNFDDKFFTLVRIKFSHHPSLREVDIMTTPFEFQANLIFKFDIIELLRKVIVTTILVRIILKK